MYIHVPTGQYPIKARDIRAAYPNTSFPSPFEPPPEYVAVATVSPPAFDPITHRLIEAQPADLNGAWTQQWALEALSAEEAAANQVAADTALYDSIVQATQARLDTFAKTRGYDSILSACTYASSSVVKFSTEGQYCVDARDGTWAALLAMLAEVQAGTRPRPSGYADIESELPALVWP